MNVPAIPSTAPNPYPNINSSPFVAAGAIGKVSSEAKFIETGIIGTKNIPRTIKFRPTRTLLYVWITNIPTMIDTKMPIEIVLIAIKNLCVFYNFTETTRLATTPKIAVDAP